MTADAYNHTRANTTPSARHALQACAETESGTRRGPHETSMRGTAHRHDEDDRQLPADQDSEEFGLHGVSGATRQAELPICGAGKKWQKL